MVLKLPDAVLTDSKVKITYNSTRLAVYKSDSFDTPIASGSQIDVSTFGISTILVIEGIAAGTASGGDQIQITLTPKNGDVSRDKTVITVASANLAAVKTDSSELADKDKEAPGAYVPVNNDNDDYDLSGTGGAEKLDKDKTGAITGENDLVPLKMHKIALSLFGAKYRLVFTSTNIKLWKNADHSEAIASDSTESATQDTTVYVEGLANQVLWPRKGLL